MALPIPPRQMLRALSTTPAFRYATPVSSGSVPRPQTGPTQVPPTQGQDIPINDAATLDYQGGLQYEVDTSKGPSGAYPDYSKGPSALDKAGQLFFFTEILRGEQS